MPGDESAEVSVEQLQMCSRFNVPPVAFRYDKNVGVARNVAVKPDLWPLNGLRHSPETHTTGWFIWAGDDLPQDADFFVPMHARHIAEIRPICLPYLALPPGWRFLIAPGHEDVWYDESLLNLD